MSRIKRRLAQTAVTVRLGLFSLRISLLLLGAMMLTGCTGLFFYPQSKLLQTPAAYDISWQDVWLKTADDVKLHSWWLQAKSPSRGVILFLHGNAENISTHIASVAWLADAGFDVLALDYRGFGQSEGDPSIPAVYADLDAAYHWCLDSADKRSLPVLVLGQSLGAALATTWLGSLPDDAQLPNAVALDAVFSSYRGIARHAVAQHWLTWPLQALVPVLVPGRFDPIDFSKDIQSPVLFFHSREDQVVPFDDGRRTFDAVRSQKVWIETQGPHISTFHDTVNRQRLVDFWIANS